MMGDIEALYIGFTIIWVGVLGYMLYIHVIQRKLARDLTLLGELVKKNERK